MKTKIFYFSATGNSLQVARDLAAELGETELISIAGIKTDQTELNEDMAGLVFPVHAWGVPRIVVDFIEKFRPNKDTYIFSVVTCGGAPGGTLLQLHKLLEVKGLKLSAGFSVKQPDNYIIWNGAGPKDRQQAVILESKKRIKEIAEIIKEKRVHRPETSSVLFNYLGSLIHPLFLKNTWRQAKNFWVTDKCNLCLTCVKLCPVGNITIAEGKPKWGDKCIQCLACLQWCSPEAIQYKQRTLKRRRYHHPEIQVKDLLD